LDDFVAIVVEFDVGGGVVAAVEIDVVLGGRVDTTKVRLRTMICDGVDRAKVSTHPHS
jgi:hypothetical protein